MLRVDARQAVLLAELSLSSEPRVDYASIVDDEFLARLRAVVRGTTRNEHDADDVVQDSLVKLLRKGGAVPAASVRAWLFTVARREAIDRTRRSRTVPLTTEVPAPNLESGSATEYLAACLGPMLEDLPPADRDVLRRIDVDGESQADVARSLGISASTVKSRVQRARNKLLARLEACCVVERDRAGAPLDHHLRPGQSCGCSDTARRIGGGGGIRTHENAYVPPAVGA